ncbi:flagellar basal body rod protein FlgC [Bacillota bacterium LX-D]|nr:flagellar basal body rod protein FlgC [Bacillota bacterium LX-D]
MRFFDSLAISATGLSAERLRMDLISSNIANVNTTRTAEGGTYKREVAVFAEKLDQALQSQGKPKGQGVEVVGIVQDNSPDKLVYDPSHPDADSNGYVHYPNINIVSEMVDMITATRSYEANLTILNAGKSMAQKALEIGK